MKHIFIVNPTSGKGASLRFVSLIQKYFEQHPDSEYEIIETQYPRHASEITANYHKEDDVCIYSIGGDGTASEVLDGIQPGVSMCVLPGGSGNDFFKCIPVNKKWSDQQLIEACIEGENVDIDYGVIDGKKRFINVTSLGLDADVNAYANNYVKKETKVPGSLAYGYAALHVISHLKVYKAEIEVDDQLIKQDVLLVAIANGQFYGGGFQPVPFADLKDGKLDVCIVRGPIKMLRLLKLLVMYAKGKHTNEKEATFLSGERVKIRLNQQANLQADGEDFQATETEIVLQKSGLSYRMPKLK